MKKIQRIVLIAIMLFTLTLFTGCTEEKEPEFNPENELATALNTLQESSYTVETTVTTEVEVVANGQNQTQKVEYEMLTKYNGNESYVEMTINGEKICSYAIVDGDSVKTYTNIYGEWIQGDDITLSDYQNENNEMLNIEVEDCFELKDDKWIGDTTKISEQLKGYMEDAFKEYTEYGMDIVNIIVNQYDITMDGDHISNVDLKMTMTMSSSLGVMKITITMPMKYSKIGQTEVIRPEI